MAALALPAAVAGGTAAHAAASPTQTPAGQAAVRTATVQQSSTATKAARTTPFYDSLVNYHSGKCLEVPAYSKAKGVQLQQWTCNGGKNQKWLQKYAQTSLGLKLYFFVNEHSGQCMSVKGGSSKNGTPIIQWPCRVGDKAELFALLKVSGVHGLNFVIWNAGTGKYPQVNGASQANGAKVSQWSGQSKHHFYWSWR